MTESATKTVGARDVQTGDEIDGRRVRIVRAKPYSSSTRNGSNGSVGHLPNLTFTSKVVVVHFEDGPPKYLWPHETVEVIR